MNDKDREFERLWLRKLKAYAKILANPYIPEEEVISIAYWRIIKYGKYTPENIWVPLCRHVSVETKKRKSRAPVAPAPNDSSSESVDMSIQLMLDEALKPLTKLERWLLLKYYGEGYTYEVLGATIGVGWMTARNRIKAAMEKVRSHNGEK